MTEQSPIALCGIGVSPGVAHGPIAWLGLPPSLPDSDVPEPDRAAAQARLKDAFGAVADFLEHRAASAPAAAADVLLAQSMMVADPTLHQRAADELDAGHSAAHAANAAFRYFSDQLRAAGGYVAERAADLADLRDRVLAHLLGAPMPGIPNPGHPIVLAAQDLAPADTAVLDPSAVLAIVTSRGGPTSHTAILAKSLGIPAIVGCGAVTGLDTDTMVLVDGTAATVRTDPTAEEVAGARARAADRAAAIAAASGPGMTSDGAAVSLLVNIGAARDLAAAAETDSEGVGLMRTEFLYLDRASAPTRAEQQAGYAEVFAAFAGRKVVVRTLDAGADKPLA
ncbi:MAG: putative PEP-binding protein, partial [Sciscionella sp.]